MPWHQYLSPLDGGGQGSHLMAGNALFTRRPSCAARGCAAAPCAVSWPGKVQEGGLLRSRCTAQQLLQTCKQVLPAASP